MQDIIIDKPQRQDASTIATLFLEDMQTLKVQTSHEALLQLAHQICDDLESACPRSICRVARLEAGGEPVGVILANNHFSLKFAGPAYWIEELYVTPRARRMGIGRILVEELLDIAEETGIAGVDIEAYQGNTPASILYRSLGFYRLGRERFCFSIEAEDS